MNPDEVIIRLQARLIFLGDYLNANGYDKDLEVKALQSAISLIQDYQKLRERVSVEKIEFLLSNLVVYSDGVSDRHKTAEQIVTYLQQPTEH